MLESDVIELGKLEYQIDELIRFMKRLKQENLSLRHQLSQSQKECAKLRDSNHATANKIKTVISQLKGQME